MAIAPPLRAPRRETLVEAVAHNLIRYIAENQLHAGDRLPSERELVTMVGASRLPLREALSVLKGLGIIEAQHGRGIFVKRLDMAALFGMLSPLLRAQADLDVRHLLEVRLSLEVSTAELAAAHRNDSNLQTLADAVAGMHANVRSRAAFSEHDTTFHQELARSTGNPVFHVLMSALTDLLAELQGRYLDRIEYRQQAILEHEAILTVIQSQDAAAARGSMQRHICNAMERL